MLLALLQGPLAIGDRPHGKNGEMLGFYKGQRNPKSQRCFDTIESNDLVDYNSFESLKSSNKPIAISAFISGLAYRVIICGFLKIGHPEKKKNMVVVVRTCLV